MTDCDRGDLPVLQTDLAIAFFSDREGIIIKNLEDFFPGVPVHVFPSIPPQWQALHTAKFVAECLKSAGLKLDPQKVLEEASSGAILFNKLGLEERDSIVVHPGSGSSDKNYPPEFWACLLEMIFSKAELRDLKPVILMGPAEETIYKYLASNMKSLKDNVIQCPDREGLMEILGRAAVYIGHDSGITHLSAMLGAPTIALFKSTDVRQWKPLGPRVMVLSKRKSNDKFAKDIVVLVRHFLNDEV